MSEWQINNNEGQTTVAVSGMIDEDFEFEKLIEELEPERIARAIDIPLDSVREGFGLKRMTISNYEEFMGICSRFHGRLLGAYMGRDIGMPRWMGEEKVIEILNRSFGSIGGLGGAFKIASTGEAFKGARGGMAAILDAIYISVKNELKEYWIGHAIKKYVSPIDWDDRVDLMCQYLRRYGGYVSQDNKRSAMELATNAENIIRMHLEVTNSLRPHIKNAVSCSDFKHAASYPWLD